MDTRKHVLDLEAFREMLHISPRIPVQSFDELPFEEEILEFLRFLGHSIQIKTLTDVNVNKLYQPWRSFDAVINKCLTGKSSGIDSLRISQAQILWGLYHGSNPSIARRNKVNWHYVRDDVLFTTIKVVSRHQTTQQYGVILPIEVTNDDIRNIKAYKEYYAYATGEAAPKLKASARKKTSGSASSTTPPTPIATPTPTTTVVAAPRLSAAAKGKQPAKATTPTEPTDVERTKAEQLKIVLKRSRQETHISQQRGSGTDEGTGSKPGVPDVPSDESEEEISWDSSDDEDVDEQTKGREESEGDKIEESDDDADDQDEANKFINDDDDEEETTKIGELKVTESDEGDSEATESDTASEDEETREQEEESFDPIPQTPEDDEDDDNNEEDQGVRIDEEERMQEEEDAEELYRDVDINQGRGLQVSQETEYTHVILTLTQSDAQQESSSTSSFMTNLLNPVTDPGLESLFTTGSTTVTPIPSPQSTMTPSIMVKSLEDNFSNILGIVNQYIHQQMPEVVREAMQTQTNQLQDSIQRENDEFLKTIDENMKKIIKEQVKSQVKAQVTRILPRIEEAVNAQLEAEVLTRSFHSSRTSYAVAADLSKMELKKILIEKMEGNKSIQRSNEQQNLYKALVEAYDADKIILDTYGESTILKRRREDDDQEGPSAGSDRGSKRPRGEGEHASASTPSEPATGSAGRTTTGSQSRQLSTSESAFIEEPVQLTCQMEEPSHLVFETGADDQPIVQPSQHPEWFSQPSRPPTPDRDWNKSMTAAQGEAQSWISALAKQTDARSSFNELLDTPIDFSNFIMNRLGVDTLTPELLAGPTYELMRGSCISLTELEYHLEEVYKATTAQLDWVNPEGQQYPHNLLQPLPLIPDNRGRSVIPFDHFINNDLEYLRGDASSRKYTTSEPITYEKHALWGFAVNRESALDVYSKRRIIAVTELKIMEWHNYKHLDWVSPDTYRPDLKRREAYTAYSNPRGFIYQNKDKKKRLMWIDELHKFSDRTLNDVRNAFDDRLKGIQMQYLPTTIWKRGDKTRAAAMIQAIDKMLTTKIIMRSLERFVGGRPYEGDFRMLQRTI
nr:hypothetical protein [Tanacetum cinerariifolium]